MKTLTASDRTALIKLASTLPQGSEERRAILSGLKSAVFLPSISDADQVKILEQVGNHFERRYGLDFEIDEEGAGLDSPVMYAWDENDEPAYRSMLDVQYDDINGWTVGVGTSRHGFSTSFGEGNVRDIIRHAEKVLKKEAPSLLVGRQASRQAKWQKGDKVVVESVKRSSPGSYRFLVKIKDYGLIEVEYGPSGAATSFGKHDHSLARAAIKAVKKENPR